MRFGQVRQQHDEFIASQARDQVAIAGGVAQALGDGTWTVNVSGKDAAGNTVSGS